VGFTEYIGYDGVGIFNQSGGTNTTPHLNVGFGHSGDPSTSMGSYLLSGGSLMVNGQESVSLNVNGTFTQSGGTNSSTQLAIGRNQLAKTGLFLLSGTGSVSTGTEYVGSQEGTGTLTQSESSTNTVTTALNVAADLGTETGNFNLNGGSLSSPSEYIGCNVAVGINNQLFVQGGGTGNVAQTAGTNTVSYVGTNTLTGKVFIGASTSIGTSSGRYSISDTGVLTTASIFLGTAGTLSINGGTINTNDLFHDSGSTFSWTAGTLNFTTDESWDPGTNPSNATGSVFGNALVLDNGKTLGIVGNETLAGTAAPNNFTLTMGSGGVNNVSGNLAVFPHSALNVNGGTLNVGGLNLFGDPTRLNWTSGTVHLLNSVTWDSGAAGTSTSAAFGSSLTLANNKTLSVTGDETLGNSGFFNLNVNSGGSNNVTGALTVNSFNALNVGGGTVTAATLTVHNFGQLSISSGTVTANSVTFEPNDALIFTLSGTSLGTGYGTLTATGTATLGCGLMVNLNGFTPSAGNVFHLFSWGSVSGTFIAINLPLLGSGLTWNTSRLYTDGVLFVNLPGDYNRDGVVDAADYTIWRDTLGSTIDLRANGDNTGASAGVIDQADYAFWKSRFGNRVGSGAGGAAAVPEPASLLLLLSGTLAICSRRYQRPSLPYPELDLDGDGLVFAC
jgi:hypothetical protein